MLVINTSASANSTSTAPTPTCRFRAGWCSWRRKHNLFLHAHSDVDAVERLFKQWPQARILWAHAGFERPERVAEMLRKHKNLWADLAFRTDHASGGKVDPAWRATFLAVSRPLHGRHRQLRPGALALHPRARRLVAALARGPAARRRRAHRMEKRRSGLRLALAAAGLICRRRGGACEPALEGTRLESPRFVLAFKPEAISVAQHFALEIAVCAKSGSQRRKRSRSTRTCRSTGTA